MRLQLLPAMLVLGVACSTASLFAQAVPAVDKTVTTQMVKKVKKVKDATEAAPAAAAAAAPAATAKVKDTAAAAAPAVKKAHKGGPSVNASAAEIAGAKAKGLVWVNTGTRVYHKDGEYFGATKEGKFMTEAEAQKANYRAAKDPAAKAAKPAATK